jgi:hypothetical protein
VAAVPVAIACIVLSWLLEERPLRESAPVAPASAPAPAS